MDKKSNASVNKIVQIDESQIQNHLYQVVRGTVRERGVQELALDQPQPAYQHNPQYRETHAIAQHSAQHQTTEATHGQAD